MFVNIFNCNFIIYLLRNILRFYKYIPLFLLLFIYWFYLVEFSLLLCEDDPDNSSLNSNVEYESLVNNDKYSKLLNVLIKFKNKGKRALFWSFKEKYTGNYDSYKEFKKSWDPNLSIRSKIKKDFQNGFEGIIRIKNVLIYLNKIRRDEPREFKRPKKFTPRFNDYFGNETKKN
jgi:hypothetical protein